MCFNEERLLEVVTAFSGSSEGCGVFRFGLGECGGVVRVSACIVELAVAELDKEEAWLLEIGDLWLRS